MQLDRASTLVSLKHVKPDSQRVYWFRQDIGIHTPFILKELIQRDLKTHFGATLVALKIEI